VNQSLEEIVLGDEPVVEMSYMEPLEDLAAQCLPRRIDSWTPYWPNYVTVIGGRQYFDLPDSYLEDGNEALIYHLEEDLGVRQADVPFKNS